MMQKHGCIQLKIMVVAAIAMTCLFSRNVLAKDTLIIGWDDWAPHQMENKKGELVGVNIELITEICNRAGFKAEFKKMPWKRNLKDLKTGKVDIAMSASKTEERAKYAYFSDTYFKLEYNVMFIRKKDKAKFSSIKSLKDIIGTHFRVGVTRGSVYSDEYEQLLNNKQFLKNIEEVNQEDLNVRKLIKNRIDCFIADELGGASLIKELGFENEINILFYLYGENDAAAYLMFSKKSMTQEQVDKMNKALNEMKSDGTYQKLLNKYQLKK